MKIENFDNARKIIVKDIFYWYKDQSTDFPSSEVRKFYSLFSCNNPEFSDISKKVAAENILTDCRHFLRNGDDETLLSQLFSLIKN